MSKFSNILKLQTLLQSRKRLKRKDIAKALGVSERMVRKYIQDLQLANVNIKSISGPNGGYELVESNYIESAVINESSSTYSTKNQNYIKEYIENEIGKFNTEEIALKLLIRKPISYSVSEKIQVPKQIIKWNKEDESIIYTAKITGKQDIIKWILSMGTAVTILEPEILKDEIKEILKNMIEWI